MRLIIVTGLLMTACLRTVDLGSVDDGGAGGGGASAAGGGGGGSGACGGFGPIDRGFENQPVAWQLLGAAQFDATGDAGPGAVDPGFVVLDGGSAVSQALVAQPASCGGLAVEVNGAAMQCIVNNPDSQCGVLLNDTVGIELPPGVSSKRTCVGDWGYGTQLTARAWLDSPYAVDPVILLDHVDYQASAACPRPGEVVNGDFEGAAGWTLSGGADIDAGPVTGDTRVAHFVTATQCDRASITGTFSVPTAAHLPNAALRLMLRTGYSNNASASVSVQLTAEAPASTDSKWMELAPNVPEVVPSIVPSQTAGCLPEWTKGRVVTVTLNLERDQCSGGVPWVNEFFIDNLELVSEPKCPLATNLLGGDFEQDTQYWTFSNPIGPQLQYIFSPAPVAHSGSAALRLSVDVACQMNRAMNTFTVPAANGSDGPAVKFWYQIPQPGASQFSVKVTGKRYVDTTLDPLQPRVLTPVNGWTQVTVCLDPKYSGVPNELAFMAAGPGGVCSASTPHAEAWFDDVEVTTDPACPPH